MRIFIKVSRPLTSSVVYTNQGENQMTSSWTEVFNVEVDGRPIKGEVYIEGEYKISTTQKNDYEGKIFGDESSKVFMPPSETGILIEIEAETLEELNKNLIAYGEFSEEDAKVIIEKFNI